MSDTLVKKTAPGAAKKPAKKTKKTGVKPVAFVNWSAPTNKKDADGNTIYMDSNRGFTIFDEGDYVDAKEVLLSKAAEKHGGVLVLKNVTLTIRLNTPSETPFSEDDFL